ncbi:pyruvate oxidase [Siccirubricoccus deserti]|uniref:Pyruvate oxidase n=1 Tax=Siccirubricoccus deserti TaxID=2013562 RepID=A0A9X0QZQ0_9PROT|nr:thiamine pyrophosphate-dependent enzyme [Siccirubricoccus deserti]MBC4015632.1 pyruvate oxidase [Siccirubricoccus deserti]GGC43266.1 pyruvate oxidase [Siccirubricoccus deserti]
MPQKAADILVETLIDWGIDTVYGLPGDGINGIMEALRTRQERIRFIQVRHEESAAFMACAHAKWTGRIGCCLSTSGPGGIHLLNGLYDAKLDRAPVLAITGLQYHDLLETFTQQDVDLDKLFQDVSVFNTRVMGAAHMAKATALACRSALARQGVAHLSVPVDVQEEAQEDAARSPRNKPHPLPSTPAEGLLLPRPGDVARAAEILNGASRVAILAGRGALGATAELERCADLLAAPVAKALLGKAVLPDTHPLTTGGIGLYGTFGTHHAMAQCDALLIIGSSFPYVEYYPQPGQARGVQIDRDAQRIGLRHPAEVGLVGDARATLEALNAQLRRKTDRAFLEATQAEARRWRDTLSRAVDEPRQPMHPAVPVRALSERLPADAVVVTDSGHNTGLTARYLDLGPGHAFGVSGLLASMACGLPYAVAAALAFPGRAVFGIVGDGGLAMQLGELATAVRYRLPVKLLVIKNNTFGQIKWEQLLFLGNPEYACDLTPIDFARAAEAIGARGFSVRDPAQLGAALDAMLAVEGPVVLEVEVDPNEPLLPAVVSESYRKNLEKALAQGTAGAEALRAALGRSPAREMLATGGG